MTLTYTEQQRAALETPLGPIAVDAGAGCGKTFVLTERFLSHLDPTSDAGAPQVELDELVAITFTDAAAREMRSRIRARCRERLLAARGDDVAFWRRLLRSLDGARVSTIHAFASRLIRDHAIELGVDPAFTVLDPAAAVVLEAAAVDEALRSRLTVRDGDFDEDLIATAAEFDITGLRSRVRQLMDHVPKPGFAKWLRAAPEDLVDAWLLFYRQEIAPRYATELRADPAIVELLELLGEATPVTPGFAERIADLRDAVDALTDTDDADAALKRFQPLLALQDPETRKHVSTKKDWPDGETKKAFTAVVKSLRDRLAKQRRAGSPDSMRRSAELGLQVQRLAADAAKRFAAVKRARGVLDNDDLLKEAHRLLTDAKLADARRRIAGQVRVLLVDEFQDTDPLQAELVQAIVGGEASTDEPPTEDSATGGLFFVGDFKQSIYRFRGAAPEVFQQMRANARDGGQLTLSQNFRSQPAVLDFVNTLFGDVFGDDYAPLTASRPQATERPAVEFLWTPSDDEATDAASQRRAEAASIAGRLRELIDSDAPVVVDERSKAARPLRPGDVAILFRALSDVAAYEEALRDAGLEYYLVGGHAFYAQQEVFDVLNLLRCMLSECDEIALAGALRSPFFGLTDEALFWLAQRGGLNAGLFAAKLPAELADADRDAVTRAREVVSTLRRQKNRLGAAAILNVALEATGYDAALITEFLGVRKLANFEKLHEQARQADALGTGLRGLVERLAEFVRQPPKEALAATTAGDADVVRLMTVHASKGLEFPLVVLPDLNRRVQSDQTQATYHPRLGPLVRQSTEGSASSDKGPPVGIDFWRAAERPAEEAERDRLFYVACTRAADRLILSSCYDTEAKLEGPWLKRLDERFDLFSGVRLDDEAAESLVTVTVPTRAAASKSETRGPSLRDALEATSKAAKPPVGVAPIAIAPADLTTFSVSRLSGQLRRDGYREQQPTHTDERSAVDPRRLGTLVHAVIERLDPTAKFYASQIDRLAATLAPQHLRRNVEEGVAETKRLVTRFVGSAEWAAMRAAPRLDREVEFFLRWPVGDAAAAPVMLRGYLDALYQDDAGGWHVVDYKTNAVTAGSVPEVAERYALQMAVYAHAVEAAVGTPPESLTLAFLSAGAAHLVPWDAAARETSAKLITEAITTARDAARESPE